MTRSFLRKEDAEAFEMAEKRKKQLQKAGLDAPQDKTLFLDFSKAFISRRYKALARSSVDHDEGRLRNYWLEKFGLRPLSTITSAEIKQQLDHIQFELGHSPADRNRHRALLHTLYQEAFMEDRVLFNPVARIPLIEEKRTKRKTVLKEASQIEAYLDALRAEGPHYGMIGEIMAWTGARVCAAIALQWHDVHFSDGIVLIRRIEERAGGSKIVERTKGRGQVDDERDAEVIPLFPRLREALLAHRQRTHFTKPHDFIACRGDGSYIPYDTFKDVHKRAIASADLPAGVTPHTLRASFATLAKKAGYTRAEIREMLGHSSEAVTARYDLRDIAHLVEKGKQIGFGSAGKRKLKSVRGGR